MKNNHYKEIESQIKQLYKFIETQGNVIFMLLEEIKYLKTEQDAQARKIAEANFGNNK